MRAVGTDSGAVPWLGHAGGRHGGGAGQRGGGRHRRGGATGGRSHRGGLQVLPQPQQGEFNTQQGGARAQAGGDPKGGSSFSSYVMLLNHVQHLCDISGFTNPLATFRRSQFQQMTLANDLACWTGSYSGPACCITTYTFPS